MALLQVEWERAAVTPPPPPIVAADEVEKGRLSRPHRESWQSDEEKGCRDADSEEETGRHLQHRKLDGWSWYVK